MVCAVVGRLCTCTTNMQGHAHIQARFFFLASLLPCFLASLLPCFLSVHLSVRRFIGPSITLVPTRLRHDFLPVSYLRHGAWATSPCSFCTSGTSCRACGQKRLGSSSLSVMHNKAAGTHAHAGASRYTCTCRTHARAGASW